MLSLPLKRYISWGCLSQEQRYNYKVGVEHACLGLKKWIAVRFPHKDPDIQQSPASSTGTQTAISIIEALLGRNVEASTNAPGPDSTTPNRDGTRLRRQNLPRLKEVTFILDENRSVKERLDLSQMREDAQGVPQ